MPLIFHQMKLYLLIIVMASSCTRQCRIDSAQTPKAQVHMLVWGEYTSQTLFDDFTAATGIEVTESNFASNEELLAKIQTGVGGYDLIIPSDYMVAVMASLDLLSPLDLALIPNMSQIDPSLLNQDFDPENRWSIPYSWAITGITYNKTKVKDPISSYQDLLTRPELRLRFSILDDSREAFGAALKSIHQSANATDPKILAAARDVLIEAKSTVREFTATPAALLESGDLLAAQIYSNESLRLHARRPEFEFIVPSDGYTIAIDSFAIPKNAPHKAGALALVNFLLKPENNLKFSEELLAAPVIKDIVTQLPKPLAKHPAIRSFAAIKSRGDMLRDVGDAIRTYDRMWTEVKVSEAPPTKDR